MCTHGLPACLFVCMLACLCGGDFQEKSRDRKNGTAVECVCLGEFAPHQHVLVFDLLQSKVAWRIQNSLLLVDFTERCGDSSCQMDQLQPVRRVVDTGSEL